MTADAEYHERARLWNWVLQAFLVDAINPNAIPATVRMLRDHGGPIAAEIEAKTTTLIQRQRGIAIDELRSELRLAEELAEL